MTRLSRYVCVLSLLFTATASACQYTVRASVAKDWPPYSYMENGSYKGLDFEIVTLILTNAGLCLTPLAYPSSSRAFAEFRKDNVDLIFAASKSSAREGFAVFSRPYRHEDMLLFTHVENNAPVTLSQAKLIAINRGSFYGDDFEVYKTDCPACVVTTNLAEERLGLLKMKRVDYAIEDALTGAYLILNGGYAHDVKATQHVINSNPVYLMLNSRTLTPEQMQQINQAIQSSQAQINDLVSTYMTHFDLQQLATLPPEGQNAAH